MGFDEYVTRMKGAELRKIDNLDTQVQALWLNRAITNVDEKGRYTVKDYKDILDTSKIESQLTNDGESKLYQTDMKVRVDELGNNDIAVQRSANAFILERLEKLERRE